MQCQVLGDASAQVKRTPSYVPHRREILLLIAQMLELQSEVDLPELPPNHYGLVYCESLFGDLVVLARHICLPCSVTIVVKREWGDFAMMLLAVVLLQLTAMDA